MKREFSAGGIVFNDQGQVLLILSGRRDYWLFPKGHVDEGETTKEAALREVREEGGVEAEIISKVGDSRFIYTSPEKEKIFKIVTYFLMRYLSGDSKDHDWEIKEATWYGVEEALTKLSFKNDKKLLQQALEIMRELS